MLHRQGQEQGLQGPSHTNSSQWLRGAMLSSCRHPRAHAAMGPEQSRGERDSRTQCSAGQAG